MILFQFNTPQVKETDQTPDPLFNPYEVTKVKDILDLHRRGINVTRPSNSRSAFDDLRDDYTKLSSPNLESDKLFPNLPRLVAQNSHYKSALQSRLAELEEQKKIEDFKASISPSSEPEV